MREITGRVGRSLGGGGGRCAAPGFGVGCFSCLRRPRALHESAGGEGCAGAVANQRAGSAARGCGPRKGASKTPLRRGRGRRRRKRTKRRRLCQRLVLSYGLVIGDKRKYVKYDNVEPGRTLTLLLRTDTLLGGQT
ncbi:unnamed protein product [Laminaria digitata]